MRQAAPTIPWYRSIRFKLVATAVVVEMLMLGLLLANSYRLLSETLESQTQSRLEALTPLLNASLAGRVFQRDHSEIQSILQQLVGSRFTEIRYIVVLDHGGQVLASSGEDKQGHGTDNNVAEALADLTYDTEMPLTLPADTQVGTVHFGLSLTGLANLRGNVLAQSLWIAAAEILLSLLLLASGGYLLTRHIAALLAGTRRIIAGDYGTTITVATDDEIGELAADFNTMTATVQNRIADLAESESRFRTIFDAAGDAIFIHDAGDGRVLDVNARMCEMFRCTRAQALGATTKTISANIGPFDAEHAGAWMRKAAGGETQTFDWLARRFDGEEFWVEVSLRLAQIGADRRIIAVVRDISERKRHQHELEFLAHHDPLTHLPNRVLLADRLQHAIAQTQRTQRLLAIAYLDLDGFKEINDGYGHKTGDRLLTLVAQRLKEQTRAGDTLSRLGGDEFVILLGDLATIEECSLTIERLLEKIAQPYQIDGHTLRISASIGLTVYPFDDADTETLLRHADQAMYLAKQGGRNRYHLFDAEHDRLAQIQQSVRTRVEAALANREFLLHYQPKVNMRTGRVVGAEALIRWQHPEQGLLPPASFLPMVEDSHFAAPLGEWVIGTALAQMESWRAAGLELGISVNISARHLQASNFAERLAALLAAHPAVPPACLELEVVESVALEDMLYVSQVVDACHRLGVTFALDDFGTGYSSLSYFKQLRVDTLKIDQSFVRDMLEDEEDYAIVAGVIGLTHSFKRQAVAEGVENAAIGEALLALGCTFAQGYGIARPMPGSALPEWIAAWHAEPLWRPEDPA